MGGSMTLPVYSHGLHERQVTFGEGFVSTKTGLFIPETMSKRVQYGPKPLAIDLFSGAGGFSVGVIQAGFRVVAALDNWELAVLTYLHNLATFPVNTHFVETGDHDRLDKALEAQMKLDTQAGVASMPLAGHGWISTTEYEGVPHFWFGDIRKVSGAEILKELGLERGDIDLVVGGPPCQGFSVGGKRNIMDPRNSLVFEFARLVLEIWPKSFCMENVPGIRSMKTPEGWPVMDAFCRLISDGGWASFNALQTYMGQSPERKAAFRADGGESKPGKKKAKGVEEKQASFAI
ncbi:MAG: DNA cytosine methyltransferase [Gaiellales bacterium]|nr:MAG: DNA cytosine methyltransferase [Gaiellales bacterium]